MDINKLLPKTGAASFLKLARNHAHFWACSHAAEDAGIYKKILESESEAEASDWAEVANHIALVEQKHQGYGWVGVEFDPDNLKHTTGSGRTTWSCGLEGRTTFLISRPVGVCISGWITRDKIQIQPPVEGNPSVPFARHWIEVVNIVAVLINDIEPENAGLWNIAVAAVREAANKSGWDLPDDYAQLPAEVVTESAE
mgnify:CR=1 FL=1